MVKVGIVGGSGLDDPDILKDATEVAVETPYGAPTSVLTCGAIEGIDVVIIARHGKDHSIYPTKVNFRANIWVERARDDVESANRDLEAAIATMRAVLAQQRSELAAIRKSTASNSALAREVTEAQGNLRNMERAIDGAEGWHREFSASRSVVKTEGQLAGIDPEIAALSQRIATMRTIANSLASEI